MPTTIDSAGITFNDATSLTSANIGTAQLVNGSVTAAKLGTNEQKQIAKAWVNFNGVAIESTNLPSTVTISCNSGSTTGTYTISTGGWSSSFIGVIYKITQINGVVGGTLGGVNVSTLGIQIISVESSTSATFRFLSGTTTSAQSVTGTGSASSGISVTTSGIRSSYNVTSVTKTGTGQYTINFTVAMADANYSVSFTTNRVVSANIAMPSVTSTSTTSFNVICQDIATSAFGDCTIGLIQVFGN
jgi:hypothetical protein